MSFDGRALLEFVRNADERGGRPGSRAVIAGSEREDSPSSGKVAS
jgi:hypothetical protein